MDTREIYCPKKRLGCIFKGDMGSLPLCRMYNRYITYSEAKKETNACPYYKESGKYGAEELS